MNIVKELRKKKGIQQKELALEIGVSIPTVSNWEHGKSDPSGERLAKLSKYFDVDELVILGAGSTKPNNLIKTKNPKEIGISETDQIVEQLLQKLSDPALKIQSVVSTSEARILARGVDKLPKAQREQALNVVKAMFSQYADYFREETDDAT